MKRSIFLATCLVLVLAAQLPAAKFPGAAWTSLNDGTTVNANLYTAKEDVYLNGGPQNVNASGLPDGLYFYQVTNPNGQDLLSTDPAACRVVQVVAGRIVGVPGTALPPDPIFTGLSPIPDPANLAECEGVVINGNKKWTWHQNGSLSPSSISIPVRLCGYQVPKIGNGGPTVVCYDNTTNPGGEYKAWLIPKVVPGIPGCAATPVSPGSRFLNFTNDCAKTDNFKVKEQLLQKTVAVSGMKYYDANDNGQNDSENGIQDWPILVTVSGAANGQNGTFPTTTGSLGRWSWVITLSGNGGTSATVTACEAGPPTGWQQKDPTAGETAAGGVFTTNASRCWTGSVNVASCPADPNTQVPTCTGLDFGNNIPLSGLKYYDQNKNGQNDSEAGLSGWSIKIAYCNENDNPGCTAGLAPLTTPNETATTIPGGNWSAIADFPITNYRVCEVLPASWTQSDPSDGETATGGATADASRCWKGDIGFFDPITHNPVNLTSATGLIFGNYVELSGNKFYDANANRTDDNGEPGIAGFDIKIYGCTENGGLLCNILLATITTDANGDWSYTPTAAQLALFAKFSVCEVVPQCYDWWQTFPNTTPSACHLVQIGVTSAGALLELDFGNVCKVPPGFLTPGFWHNTNGESIFKLNWDVGNPDFGNTGLLNALNLVQLNGSEVNFVGDPYGSPNNPELDLWLTSESNCSNAANCLSVKLAALTLNCNNGAALNANSFGPVNLLNCNTNVTPLTPVPAACSGIIKTNGQVNISQVMSDANAELGACLASSGFGGMNTCIVSSTSDERTCMLWKQGFFDDLNNNRIKIPSSTPCPVTCPVTPPAQ